MDVNVAIQDLEHLEAMLGGIQETEVKARFSTLVEGLYLEIYSDHLTEAERAEVEAGIRIFEMEQEGWNVVHEYQSAGYSALVYQHYEWGHWRVEFFGPHGYVPDWDYQTENEDDAVGWSKTWLVKRIGLWR